MQHTNLHIRFKILAFILIIAIAIPSLLKLDHAFENHTHDICSGELSSHHIHSLEFECDFYKFQQTNSFVFNIKTFDCFSIENNHKQIRSQYHLISEYQQLSFSLRGPPFLV